MSVAPRPTERREQKERTRQRLLSAARALVDEGKTLTVAGAAQKAAVAEATAYRYYRNPRSLLRDALAIEWPGLQELVTELKAMPHRADRARRAAEALARFVLEREVSIRLLFASTNQEPRDLEAATGLPKASFRRQLVDAILDGDERSATELRRLQLSLVVVISPYAVLTLRDAMLLEREDIPGELGRMAHLLFEAAGSS